MMGHEQACKSMAGRLLRCAGRARCDVRAAATVEFALVLPLMVGFLAMCDVLGEAAAIWEKVSATSRTVTDLVTQYSTLSASGSLTQILDAAAYTMTPYSTTNLSIVVSEIQTNSADQATVTWSQAAFNGVALTVGSSVTLPTLIAQPNITLIMGQVQYQYQPLEIFYPINASIPLSDTSYWSPRISPTVILKP